MLTSGTSIFIRVAGKSEEGVLHPALIVDNTEDIFTAETKQPGELPDQVAIVEEVDLLVEAGQEVIVYYEFHRKFMQQPVRIETVVATDNKTIIGFRPLGKPVSAERRQCYRVSTLTSELGARLGEDDECQLADVSASGFSVLSTTKYDIGKVVKVEINYGDKKFIGTACVQGARDVTHGRIRYGLHGIEDKDSEDNLLEGLIHINMSVQRQQLRRMTANN